MKILLMLLSVIALVAIVLTLPLWGEETTAPDIPYECEDNLIEIMFSRDSEVRLRDGAPVDLKTNALDGVTAVLGKASVTWRRLNDLPEERLDELQAVGQQKSGQALYNLNNAYRLEIPEGEDIWDIARRLEGLPGIISARPVAKPMALPIPPDYFPLQGYPDSAASIPAGIDAVYAWNNYTGGTGSGVTVCDLEYGWNYSHADLFQAMGSQINPNPVFIPTGFDDRHGTAVLGEMFSDPNGWGTTGVCHGGILKTCGTYYGSSPVWNPAGAIIYAVNAMSTGDVILLEQQWDYTSSNGFIPIEWWLDYSPSAQTFNSVYAAIQTAVANGIHVVEAGGNGNINTDGLTWYGNSGAIIVGAGGASVGLNADRQRMWFSSYGTRFDLQGWGENVVTTGDTGLYTIEGKNYWYTNSFSGTSSASPIVAGSIALCVGFWNGLGWNPTLLTPSMVRNALVTTGTPQNFSVSGNIGPRPNVRAACSLLVLQEIEWKEMTASPIDNNSLRAFGAAWGDYDNDGDDDLHVINYNFPNKLYRNDGSGIFTDVTPPILADPGPGRSGNWADYDNDGDLDIYLTNDGMPNKLFRNDGGGAFTDVTVPPIDDPGNTQGAVWGDYDNDGFVDLFIANSWSPNLLCHNNGDGTFIDVAMGPMAAPGPSNGAVWGDYDNDGDVDLYILKDNTAPNMLCRNEGGGIFTDLTGTTPLGDMGYSISGEWVDIDGDRLLDMYLVNNGQANQYFRNLGGGVFAPLTVPPINDASYNFGSSSHDFDNDGDVDIYVTQGYHYNKYFYNQGSFTFSDRTTGHLFCSNDYSLGAACADYDGDGDVDIYVANSGPFDNSRLFENLLNMGRHWLHVKLVGTQSNRSGIGAHIEVFSGPASYIREISGGSGYNTQSSLTAMFGLQLIPVVDSIIVSWPSGTIQKLGSQSIDQVLTITEPGGAYVCGDANNDGTANVGDAVFIISYAFRGGPAPSPMCQGDANGDKAVNVGDAVFLISYAFRGGPAPVTPCCP